MRQFSNSDTSSGSKTQDNMTGIGAWFSSTNNTVLNLTASGNRKGLVVDFSDNTFDNVHAFPIGLPATPNPTVREWIDIELNAGNNIFNNTYLDHGEVWANDPRNVFMNGRIVNIAVPRTSISSAFVIPVPAGCASPCDLSKWGPLVIDGLWYNNDVTSPPANSGVPTLFKYWEPAGSGTSFAGHAPLELAADQGSYFSNTRDFYGAGSTNTAVTHFYGGNNREALIQLQDASTPPGKTNGFGSLGGCAVVNTGGIDVPICAGATPPTTVSASPPALYFNSAGGSMTTLYVKQSGSGATGWSGVSTIPAIYAGNSGSVQQAGNTTNYYIPMGQSASGNTLLNFIAKMTVPVAGTAGNLKVVSSAPGSGQSYTITLYAGNTATSLTCTISGTATQCSDTTDFPAFTAGQDMSLQIVTSSGAASAPFRWGLTFQGQ